MKKKILIITAAILVALLLVGLYLWSGWLRANPIAGCTSAEWTNPSGDLEVFADGEVSPTGNWICQADAPGGPYNWVRVEAPPAVTSCETCPPCDEPVAELEVEPTPETTIWEGDNFGPEKALPNLVNNELGAIAEIWDGADYCALLAIQPGETFDGTNWIGAYWEATSENAVIERFNHHRQEYLTENSNCHVLESITLVP